MARCGCAGSVCNCVVTAGPGTTVTGSGTPANPYVVSAEAADPTVVTVTDTNTVDSTLTGTGTAADPYVVSSNVIVDPDPDNILTATPNGLMVDCDAVAACAPAGGTTVVTVADTDTVDNTITGTGTPGDPYVISSAVIVDPAAGNTITEGPGGLYSAPGAVATGCGLRAGAGGVIEADTIDFASLVRHSCNDLVEANATEPFDPACETNGMGVYCATDGTLRTMPEKFTETNVVTINEGYTPGAALPFTSSEIELAITNPSPCYCMCGFVTFAGLLNESSSGNAQPETFYQVDLGGGSGFQEFGVRMRDTRGINSVSQERVRPVAPLNLCLDPGETKTVRFRVRWAYGPVHAGGTTQILAAAREIRFFGTNI